METAYNLLNEKQKRLVDEAERAMLNAYSPYSKFNVGAAIMTKNGAIYPGCNYENAAYGSTICAERNAVGNMIVNGEYQPEMIAIIAKGEAFDVPTPIVPCGDCRQVMNEMAQISGGLEIIMCNTKKDKIEIQQLAELIPKSFGPETLGIDVAKYRK